MAKYEKYAEYKDSGIVWMGNVPIHWTCERFKWLLTQILIFLRDQLVLVK